MLADQFIDLRDRRHHGLHIFAQREAQIFQGLLVHRIGQRNLQDVIVKS